MAESTFEGITWPDYLVIALYFIFVLVVGLIVSIKEKKEYPVGYPLVPIDAFHLKILEYPYN